MMMKAIWTYGGYKMFEEKENSIIDVTVVGIGNVGKQILGKLCSNSRSNDIININAYDVQSIKFEEKFYNNIFNFTTDSKVLSESDIIIICVPTGVRRVSSDIEIDDSNIINVISKIDFNKKSPLIIVESTLSVNGSRKIIEFLKENNQNLGTDYYFAYCPIWYNNFSFEYPVSRKKVIGCYDDESYVGAEFVYDLMYGKQEIRTTPETVEILKLYEMYSKYVSTQLANVFGVLCEKSGVNISDMFSLALGHPDIPKVTPGYVGGDLYSSMLIIEEYLGNRFHYIKEIGKIDSIRI